MAAKEKARLQAEAAAAAKPLSIETVVAAKPASVETVAAAKPVSVKAQKSLSVETVAATKALSVETVAAVKAISVATVDVPKAPMDKPAQAKVAPETNTIAAPPKEPVAPLPAESAVSEQKMEDQDQPTNKRRAENPLAGKEPSKKKSKDNKKKKILAMGGVSMFGGADLFGGKNPFASRKQVQFNNICKLEYLSRLLHNGLFKSAFANQDIWQFKNTCLHDSYDEAKDGNPCQGE